MKRSGPRSNSGRRGFTMIEMLTVIAIIAILAGILFPVFASVRKNVHKATCTTNLHSIAQGLKMYRDDHPSYPEALYGFVSGGREVLFLSPNYVKGPKEVFRCPLAPFQTSETRTVPGTHPTGEEFVRYRDRQYHAWNSYDGQFEPAKSTSNYLVKYVTHWSRRARGFGDIPRQLLYKNPPEDTVVTWCTYHRDYSGTTVNTGSVDLVLFLDGHVKPKPSNLMDPPSNVAEGRSFLVGRGS